MLATGAAERVDDLAGRADHGLGAGAGAAVVVPLGFRGKGRGVLLALDRGHGGPAFDSDDEHRLTSFAASAAIAIATAQSVEADRLRMSMHAAEHERKRWARELHDETLQELGAVQLWMQNARGGRRATGRPGLGARPRAARPDHSRSAEPDRRAAPGGARPAWCRPAVEALVERTAATSGLEIEAHIELAHPRGRSGPRLDPELSTTVYRVVQEALTNAASRTESCL